MNTLLKCTIAGNFNINMKKVIAAINMTLDGFCDHTEMIADDELHEHYFDLIRSAGFLLYGRITYQLMEYWKTLLINPTGNIPIDNFALAMDSIPKIVFSRTLKNLDWESAKLATKALRKKFWKSNKRQIKIFWLGVRA